MAQPVPPILLNLAGMPGHAGDPHLRPGNHLRVAHHPLLGLPVGPMVLQRATLDRLPEGFAPRHDAVFLDPDDQVLTQQDNPPVNGTYPTTLWLPGEIVADPYDIPLPTDLSPGEYPIQVGLYIPENGLRLADPVLLDTIVSVRP